MTFRSPTTEFAPVSTVHSVNSAVGMSHCTIEDTAMSQM